MKITAIEIKPGMIIEHKNDLWEILKTQHVKPGKGGAFNQVELKSVIKGTKLNERFRSMKLLKKQKLMKENLIFYTLMGKVVILWITKHLNKLKFQNLRQVNNINYLKKI